MEKIRRDLKKKLSKTIRRNDYIPVIETTRGLYMIWGSKVSVISNRVSYNYDLYIEARGTDREKEKFDELKNKVKIATEINIGKWKDLSEFIDGLTDKDIDSILQSIKIYE